ncbi:MAG: hypothetical protein HY898_21570 [Deltaproteobacteria bacterium]|nr:hypothetical protein [Deltaproteobacteria bacterium]
MNRHLLQPWLAVGLGSLLVVAAASCGRSEMGLFDLADLEVGGSGGSGGTKDGGKDVATDHPSDQKTDKDAPSDTKQDPPLDVPTDHPCTTAQQCDDFEYCTMDECISGMCVYSKRDMDHDNHVAKECGGNDCNDLNPQVNPSKSEVCNDGADNDCNGQSDCFDPACTGDPNCGCKPDPGGESCTNGKDDDCDTVVDCNDADCMGTPACGCLSNESGLCENGFDDDCDGYTDCKDPDCYSTPACSCKTKQEICDNKQDDNCDLLVDCADPQCANDAACTCIPPGKPETCKNSKDDDCDKLVDCADPDCWFDPACGNCVPEVCDDNKDNDCNNLIDCADPACHLAPNCAPVAEVCNNKLDDDKDGYTDCEDPDCKNNPYCVVQQSNCLTAKLIPGSGTYTGDTTGHKNYTKGSCGGDAGEAVFYFVLSQPEQVLLDTIGTSFDAALYVRRGSCEDGLEIGCDDDSGGAWAAQLQFPILYPGTYFVFVDGFTVDPNQGANEGPFQLNVTLDPNPKELCDNGLDDDGNHYVDCADPACTNVGKCLNCNAGKPPTPEFGVGKCTDGEDNDCDNKVDCSDSDCNASDYYKAECCNGQDDNGNQIIDDFACRCAGDSTCDGGQICYTHSAYSCGPPCDQFFGNICPFVAPGSICSMTTFQCEFP